MKEQPPPNSLEDLDSRLKRAQQRAGGGGRDEQRKSGIGFAFRIGTELVSGTAVGAGIGWLLDRWLGTGPWLMVVFFFLGSAAGMLNVYRTVSGIGHGVGYQQRKGPRK